MKIQTIEPSHLHHKSLCSYWHTTLEEGALHEPKLDSSAVSLPIEALRTGRIDELQAGQFFSSSSKPRHAKKPGGTSLGHTGRNAPLEMAVLVAPYVLTPVIGRARSSDGEAIAPIWIPARLNREGELRPDTEQLPFIPRSLLEPQIGTRGGRWPSPVADFNDYDQRSRDIPAEKEISWRAWLDHAEDIFHQCTELDAQNWLPPGWQRQHAAIIPRQENGAMRKILPLLAEWKTQEEPAGALKSLLVHSLPHLLTSNSALDTAHMGHIGSQPLNSEQRLACWAAATIQNGQILAINGPPGTGKTSLLKTLIADEVVRCAVSKAPPPVIAITSTNNQAVQNAAKDIAVEDEEKNTLTSNRWLPLPAQLSILVASKKGSESSSNLIIFEEFFKKILSRDFFDQSNSIFMSKYAVWAGIPSGKIVTLESAIEKLHAALITITADLSQKNGTIEKYAEYVAISEKLKTEIRNLSTEILEHEQNKSNYENLLNQTELELSERKLQLSSTINDLSGRCQFHPIWMRLLDFVPSIAAARANRLRRTVISLGIFPVAAPVFDCIDDVLDAVSEHVLSTNGGLRERQKEISDKLTEVNKRRNAARTRLSALENKLTTGSSIEKKIREWLNEDKEISGSPLIEKLRAQLDSSLRKEAFNLSMRFREAQFLGEWEQFDEKWASQSRGPKGKKTRTAFLHSLALLAPCTVGTVYMVADHFCRYDGESKTTIPLDLPIDLLIFDEAGQVSPDLGLPLLGLARKAIAVGDTKQLEPVSTFGEADDDRLLQLSDLSAEIGTLRKLGLSHHQGNVMSAFQSFSAFTVDDVPFPGIMLKDHYRCVPNIIAYCNELAYGSRLIPVKPAEPAPWISPMSWAHVRGSARKVSGSWQNDIEAATIARWLQSQRNAIEAQYGDKIENCVAIITPYSRQKNALREMIKQHLGENIGNAITVGTTHTLQGAERDLILFSPTITFAQTAGSTPFFDRGPNMLNVAVSRAKRNFVVIGDMALFDHEKTTPSGLLAKHLMSASENELEGSFEALAAAGLSELERIDGTEPHRKILAEALTLAHSRILISSPFLSSEALKADSVVSLIRAAIMRGVNVTIFTGLPTSNDSYKKAVNRSHEARDMLASTGADVRVTSQVHAKTLVVDESLIVEGSFNWLSASRDIAYARRETSLLLRGEIAAPWANEAVEAFRALKASSWAARRTHL